MVIDCHTRKILRDPLQRRAWIIYQMNLTGRTLTDLARENGVQRQTLYAVFHRRYPRMERLLANELKMKCQDLWPERYDHDGNPLTQRGRPLKNKSTTKKARDTRR